MMKRREVGTRVKILAASCVVAGCAAFSGCGMGVSVKLAGNMGGVAVNVLASHGIQVVRGCSGNIREVAQAWLAGSVGDSGASCQSHDHGTCHEHS